MKLFLAVFLGICLWVVNGFLGAHPSQDGMRLIAIGGRVLARSRLHNWLRDLFEGEDRVVDEDKRYVFDESITSSASSVPTYLFSALLSGLNVLPPEVSLKKGSQSGRRVQYLSYREIPLNWEALVDSHVQFASMTRSTIHRLVESVSLRTNEDILQQGTLRLYRFELNGEDALKVNEEMLAQANSRIQRGDDGIKVSNAGGYHSITDCFESGANARFARLCEAAVDIAEADDSTFGGKRRLLQKSENSEAWLNVNSHGCWNSLHTHTGSSWSGVYWAKVPSNDVSSGGDLLLKPSPHITETKTLSEIETLRLMIQDEIRNCALGPGCCDYINVKPVVSSLLLFPSYLQHAVVPLFVSEQHRASSAGERVSFAFNFAEL